MLKETGSKTTPSGEGCSITFECDREELDALRAMALGVSWVSNSPESKRLLRCNSFNDVPSPVDDPQIPPKWDVRKPVPKLGQCTQEDIEQAVREAASMPRPRLNVAPEIDPTEGWHSPSFYVSSAGARGGDYKRVAKELTSWGFECMRSRRGPDGRFWEAWYLPHTEHATGDLRDAILEIRRSCGLSKIEDWKLISRVVVDFLYKNSSFGSVDVAVQRAALTYD